MQTDKPATLRDVARVAQVSLTTASQALTGRGRVAPETRDRITAIARGLQYAPNTASRNLRDARTGTIGIYLHPHFTHLVFPRDMVIAGFHAANELGFDVTLLGPRDLAPGRLRSRIDGIVIADPFFDHDPTRQVLDSGLPVVAVGGTDPAMTPPAATVQARHDLVMTELLDAMSHNGMRRPGMLTVSQDFPSYWAHIIATTMSSWCDDHDVPATIQPITVNATASEIDQAVEILLARDPSVDGLILARDTVAVRALDALRRLGRSVGHDFGIGSLTDEPMLQFLHPTVSAVDLDPPRYMGLAVGTLVDILAGRYPGQDVIPFDPLLHLRESTSYTPPPSSDHRG